MSDRQAASEGSVQDLLTQQETLYGRALSVIGSIRRDCDQGLSVESQLTELNRLAQEAADVQQRVAGLRRHSGERRNRNADFTAAVSRVEKILRQLLEEIEQVVEGLQRSKQNLEPRLNEAARHRQMRSAYDFGREAAR